MSIKFITLVFFALKILTVCCWNFMRGRGNKNASYLFKVAFKKFDDIRTFGHIEFFAQHSFSFMYGVGT